MCSFPQSILFLAKCFPVQQKNARFKVDTLISPHKWTPHLQVFQSDSVSLCYRTVLRHLRFSLIIWPIKCDRVTTVWHFKQVCSSRKSALRLASSGRSNTSCRVWRNELLNASLELSAWGSIERRHKYVAQYFFFLLLLHTVIKPFHALKFPFVYLHFICDTFAPHRLLYCFVTNHFRKAQRASFSLQPQNLEEKQEPGVRGHNHKADALWQWNSSPVVEKEKQIDSQWFI